MLHVSSDFPSEERRAADFYRPYKSIASAKLYTIEAAGLADTLLRF
jgi:hypothetical protein